MPSSKDILEAQRFNRNRLITAFTSGIPGGRELESKSPFIPLIVGSVVVAIMLGVGVVMSRFAPTLPQDWQDSTLIVVKGTGARYYTIQGVLRPVTNITSARLLSEAGSYKTSRVSASTIARFYHRRHQARLPDRHHRHPGRRSQGRSASLGPVVFLRHLREATHVGGSASSGANRPGQRPGQVSGR